MGRFGSTPSARQFVHLPGSKLRYSEVMRSFLKLLSAAILALFAPFVLAREAAPVATVVATETEAHPALWKVSDADTTIYLFGTIHALPADVSWFHGPVATAFDGSQELVTEVVAGDPGALQQIILNRAVLPEGKTLRGELKPRERRAYEKAMTQLGLAPDQFDRLEPWYPAIVLAIMPLEKAGFTQEHGVEALLEARAKARGAPITGLETMDYQLGLFDALSPAVQKKYLLEVAKGVPTIVDEMQGIVHAWEAGDADRLAKLINADEDDPAMMQSLLIDRNRNWADWIKARLDKPGTIFIAVGAGHLAGAGSVQDQLKARGIAAMRVQ